MSFAPRYIRGTTGQHFGLQWFAFLSWAGWQFEVTWQQETFVAILALKKLGTGQAVWHLLLGQQTDLFGGIFPEKDAHPSAWKRCREAFLLGLSQGFLVVCEREDSQRKTGNRILFCSPTHSITSSPAPCADVDTAQPALLSKLVQQGCAKKLLSQGLVGRHRVRSPFWGFYIFIPFPSQWGWLAHWGQLTVSISAFRSSN